MARKALVGLALHALLRTTTPLAGALQLLVNRLLVAEVVRRRAAVRAGRIVQAIVTQAAPASLVILIIVIVNHLDHAALVHLIDIVIVDVTDEAMVVVPLTEFATIFAPETHNLDCALRRA